MRCRLLSWLVLLFSASMVPWLALAENPMPDPPAVHAQITIDPSPGAASNQGEGGLAWHPRGSSFTIHIAGSDPAIKLSGLGRILVHLRLQSGQGDSGPFFPAEQVQVIKQNDGELLLSAVIPRSLPAAPSLADEKLGHGIAARHTGFGVVPLLDVRILLYPGTAPGAPAATDPILDATVPLGLTSESFSRALALGIGFLFLAILAFLKDGKFSWPGSFLRIIANDQGNASLSQFQVILWTVVVGASAIYVMALSGNLIVLSPGTLTLLGVSGAAALGTNLKAKQDVEKGVVSATPDPACLPRWSDLVSSDSQEVDMPRVQMLFFTCISAAFVTMTVATREVIPDIPDTYLLLMGISNGVYFLNKFTVPNPPA